MIGHLFIVGAQRSGSTYLYEVLDGHDQVAMARPVRPEPKVFLDPGSARLTGSRYDEQLFGDSTKHVKWRGEKSTTYIECPDAGVRIRAVFPDARILMILRDPVQRAWSNYRFSVANNLERLEFGDAVDAEADRLRVETATSTNPFAYRTRGEYARYIRPYLEVFGASAVRVMIFEEFVGSQRAVSELYEWLGIDSAVTPECLGAVVNRAPTETADPRVLMQLADDLEPSVAELEDLLGRPMAIWRAAWSRLG